MASARAELKAARQACDAQFPQQIGNYVPHAKCVNTAIERIMLPIVRYPDLPRLQNAIRSVLSVKVDARQISPEDAQLYMAQADTQVAEIEHSRSIADQTVATNRMATLNNILASLQQSNPRPVITNCNRIGQSVNCSSY
jgi:hypothetical protein